MTSRKNFLLKKNHLFYFQLSTLGIRAGEGKGFGHGSLMRNELISLFPWCGSITVASAAALGLKAAGKINRITEKPSPPPAASLIFSGWTLHACVILIYVNQKSKKFREALVIGHWGGPFKIYLCLFLK